MKTHTWIITLLLAAGAAGPRLAAQSFALDSFTLGGGGTCAGGAYTISATVGQPATGFLSAGGFTVQGGFWTAPAEDGPRLRVTRLGGVLRVAWPETATGYVLQETPSLSAPDWTNAPETPLAGNGEKTVVRSLGPGSRYFRLRKL